MPQSKRKGTQSGGVTKRRRYAVGAPARFSPLKALKVGFPKKQMVKLRYASEGSMNVAVGGITNRVFRANGLFDPDKTGIGHQPLGFDQWMQFYEHYTVLKAKITLQPLPIDTSATIPSYFGVLLSANGTSATSKSSVEHLLESSELSSMPIIGGLISDQTGRNKINPNFVKWYDAKKFHNKKDVTSESELRGDAASNPTEQAFFEVFQAAIGGNDPGNTEFLVIIDYYVEFSEPRPLTQS